MLAQVLRRGPSVAVLGSERLPQIPARQLSAALQSGEVSLDPEMLGDLPGDALQRQLPHTLGVEPRCLAGVDELGAARIEERSQHGVHLLHRRRGRRAAGLAGIPADLRESRVAARDLLENAAARDLRIACAAHAVAVSAAFG